MRKRWDRSDLSLGYKYSAESDYWSHASALSGGARLWGDTATLRALARAQLRHDVVARPDAGLRARRAAALLPARRLVRGRLLHPGAVARRDRAGELRGGVPRRLPGEPLPAGARLRRLRGAARAPPAQRHHAARRVLRAPQLGDRLPAQLPLLLGHLPGRGGRRRTIRGRSASHTIEGRVFQQLGPNLEVRFLVPPLHSEPAAPGSGATPIAHAELLRAPSAVYYSTDPEARPRQHRVPRGEAHTGSAEALRRLPFLALVRRRHLRGLLRLLLPEHELRQRPRVSRPATRCHTSRGAAPSPSGSRTTRARSRRPRRPGRDRSGTCARRSCAPGPRKQAIVQVLLGSVFLVGALAYARAPDRHAQSSLAWMAGLLVLSTLDVALWACARSRGCACAGGATGSGWRRPRPGACCRPRWSRSCCRG